MIDCAPPACLVLH